MSKIHHLEGRKFGRLTAVKDVGTKGHNRLWLCQCSCGNTKTTISYNLVKGLATSCGCKLRETLLKRNQRLAKHRLSKIPEYQAWSHMMNRCRNPKEKRYNDYGGRGIQVCKRWHNAKLFFSDMGPKPTPKHTIDRINNELGYFPLNCRWATRLVQNRNTRRNKILTINGISKCISEWAESATVKAGTIYARVESGWPHDLAVNAPLWGHRINAA